MSVAGSEDREYGVTYLLSLAESGYCGIVLEKLKAIGAHIGDRIHVVQTDAEYTGLLMPRAQVGSDSAHVVVKLDNGYNVGVRLVEDSIVTLISRDERARTLPSRQVVRPIASSLPHVTLLSTGGTIASKVDYKSGAVNPALSAQDLYETVPEIIHHAAVEVKVLMSKLSENILPSDWSKIARNVGSEIRKGVDGIVIAHGTDTLALTASALAFAVQELPVPVVLVGSQRSSDRPSSDAALNLVSAIELAARADVGEVLVIMHGQTDDTVTFAHRGTRVRKCHTSRRDAFVSVNSQPLFRIEDTKIQELNLPLFRRDLSRKALVKPKFDPNVFLLKTYPGMRGDTIEYLVSSGHRGIVIEGSGLGHTPEHLLPALRAAVDSGTVVAMTSQCIWGRVNMSVYRTGVELLEIGVIPCADMLAETALVKMMWLLANCRSTDDVKELMTRPLAGEMSARSEISGLRHLRE
ncbi:MAG: Glu-tRNA(Gln) amidotransferase subunit GatD [Candidatus Thorarchaeota archaeon]|nr:Glu-tRNA(Gln) amidotransferase subunit GatD [Candidatus Thorarchaeota archaeon]